ncbi:unnamed protein product, partial [Closterium sp. Naga37s-1]
ALADMFRHKHNAPGFRMGPRRDKDSESGHRAYSTAETGTWWQEAQEFIGMDKIVAALILYSDVTHLSNNGRKKAHPVMMTLGNIAFPKRWGRPGHSLLALLPIPPSNMPSHLKVELYNACIAKLLEPLLRLKDNGVMLLDSEGIERWVVPLLYAWACDYPESGKLTCTKSGQGCMKPCSLCYVDRVLIFLVADVVGSPQLEAIRAYLDWYLCCNAASHTERSLSELQAKSTRLVKLLTTAFPEQKSKWNLIKTHLMTHFIPGIRRAGNVQEYSTNLFEHLHSTLLKQIYRRSNKRKVDTQIMKHHEMKLDSISNVATDQGVQTAMQKAIEDGARVMVKESYFFPVKPDDVTPIANWFVREWAKLHSEAHHAFAGALLRRQLRPTKVR